LYYCSCPCRCDGAAFNPACGSSRPLSFVNKVTDRRCKRASPEVSARRASQPGYGDWMVCRCHGPPRGPTSSQDWGFSFAVLMVFAGGSLD
jgi:hypothetical protein